MYRALPPESQCIEPSIPLLIGAPEGAADEVCRLSASLVLIAATEVDREPIVDVLSEPLMFDFKLVSALSVVVATF
jgi:hypothetical protein